MVSVIDVFRSVWIGVRSAFVPFTRRAGLCHNRSLGEGLSTLGLEVHPFPREVPSGTPSGELDNQMEAAALEATIPGATLLLFGGPKPGGIAMATFPKLGLDAFCQKNLVYEDATGGVKVIFNDRVAMAILHDHSRAQSHELLNARWLETFQGAVTAIAD